MDPLVQVGLSEREDDGDDDERERTGKYPERTGLRDDGSASGRDDNDRRSTIDHKRNTDASKRGGHPDPGMRARQRENAGPQTEPIPAAAALRASETREKKNELTCS